MSSMLRTTCLMCGTGLLLAVSCPPVDGGNGGQTRTFTATLSGDAEVPPVNTEGTGTSTLTVNDQTGAATFTATFSGLSGPATGAHFHQAPAGQNGDIIIDLTADFTGMEQGTVQGTATFTAAQVTELRAGNIYINLHTAANPGGEIRGQYEEQP